MTAPSINPAGFAVVLREELQARRREPAVLSVSLDHGIIDIRWAWESAGPYEHVSLPESAIITHGGPDYAARLITAKRRERREMLGA